MNFSKNVSIQHFLNATCSTKLQTRLNSDFVFSHVHMNKDPPEIVQEFAKHFWRFFHCWQQIFVWWQWRQFNNPVGSDSHDSSQQTDENSSDKNNSANSLQNQPKKENQG